MTLSISTVLINNSGAGNETVAAGATTNTDVVKTARVSGDALVALGVYARCTFNASATAGAQAYVFASPEGTQWGSDGGMQVVDIPFMAGADRSVAFSVLPGHRYYLLAVKNLDPVQSLTGVYIYAEPQVLS